MTASGKTGTCVVFTIFSFWVLGVMAYFSFLANFVHNELDPYFQAHNMDTEAIKTSSALAALIWSVLLEIPCFLVLFTVYMVDIQWGCFRGLCAAPFSAGLITTSVFVARWMLQWHRLFSEDGPEAYDRKCYRAAVVVLVNMSLVAAMLLHIYARSVIGEFRG